ncbi:hypothetical protein L3V82_00985 [Thiotrichales bacterium 19S3-7]|nr:hypothetical protein [Thiotrichales bacterium 19S3-7]MCF6800736.1 hypothetical protein [Thiotrichales bacterium 19S3-11]TNF65400.1 MAG: hypothetical protein EP298_12530 [Gammaproteobacteria bacterium]UTW41809.1 hypothetical protein KFE69_09880 [bacterium SCSIO 12844]
MQKIQVMLDDKLASNLKKSAKKAGLSISSYTRILLTSAYNKRLSALEKALKETDGDVHSSAEDFLKELNEMIDNA